MELIFKGNVEVSKEIPITEDAFNDALDRTGERPAMELVFSKCYLEVDDPCEVNAFYQVVMKLRETRMLSKFKDWIVCDGRNDLHDALLTAKAMCERLTHEPLLLESKPLVRRNEFSRKLSEVTGTDWWVEPTSWGGAPVVSSIGRGEEEPDGEGYKVTLRYPSNENRYSHDGRLLYMDTTLHADTLKDLIAFVKELKATMDDTFRRKEI